MAAVVAAVAVAAAGAGGNRLPETLYRSRATGRFPQPEAVHAGKAR
jgi:hypothetical protein